MPNEYNHIMIKKEFPVLHQSVNYIMLFRTTCVLNPTAEKEKTYF